LDTLHQQKGQVLGVPTGFADLDALLGGLHKSDMIIVAGRPSVGKTGFATCMAQHAAVEHRLPVAIFSLEMSVEQLVQRLLCSEARVDSQRLRTGYIDDEEWQRITQAFGTLSETAVFVDDTPNISTLELRTKARRLKAEQDVGLIIIDYLQLMQGRGLENRVQEVSEISRSLKGLARELAVPVVALSQLSRAVESRPDHRPILSDLRESGCLAGDTLVMRSDTGELVPIQELVGQSNIPVYSLDDHWRLIVKPIVRVFSSGHKPLFELQTATGRKIKASANHPFRTLEGWIRLDQLKPGDKIVVQLAESDIYWDEVRSILPLDTAEVFDATVADTHNFVANDFIVHNSLEQDADVVLFIHREELYNPQTEKRNIADIIVAKHRNGPTGQIPLRFFAAQTRFADLASKSFSDMA